MPFVKKKQKKTIQIKIYTKDVVLKNGEPDYVLLTEKEHEKLKKEEEKAAEQAKAEGKEPLPSKIQCLTVQMKRLNWTAQTELTDKASFFNETEGYQDVNVWKFRDLRFRNSISSWDMVDEEGKPVPINDETLGDLDPELVFAILKEYDKQTQISEEEQKK